MPDFNMKMQMALLPWQREAWCPMTQVNLLICSWPWGEAGSNGTGPLAHTQALGFPSSDSGLQIP
jgi:hypothetical protein